MADRKNSTVIARRRARERLARERAEQAARNRENEVDLVDFLTLEQRLEAADSDRDATIGAAHRRHRAVVEELKHRQGACLARMSRRGETVAAISARTGLAARDVKQLINHAPDEKATESP